MSTTIDTDKLNALLEAAKSPAFAKLLAAKEDAKKALATAQKALDKAESELQAGLTDDLKALLAPTPAPTATAKRTRKAPKPTVKLSVAELKAALKDADKKTARIRDLGITYDYAKEVVANNDGFKLCGEAPWYTIALK